METLQTLENYNIESPGFSDQDFKLMALQAELEVLLADRKNHYELVKNQIELQMAEFHDSWLEELREISSLEVKDLNTGYRLGGRSNQWTDHRYFDLYRNHGNLTLQFMLEDYYLVLNPNDEFEDIDAHDFHLSHRHIDKDQYRRIGIVLAELDSLVHRLVYWNRESERIHADIRVFILTSNLELEALDQREKELREQIRMARTASALTGQIISFETNKYRKFYYKSAKYEFVESFRVTEVSPTGKTCTVHAIIRDRKFRSTYYYALETTKTVEWKKIRVSQLSNNLYE